MRPTLIPQFAIGFLLVASVVAYLVLPTPAATVSTVLTKPETEARLRQIREKEKLHPEASTAAELLDEQARELAAGAAGLVAPGLLVARWLGEATAVRAGLSAAIVALRAAALGLPARLPRLWRT